MCTRCGRARPRPHVHFFLPIAHSFLIFSSKNIFWENFFFGKNVLVRVRVWAQKLRCGSMRRTLWKCVGAYENPRSLKVWRMSFCQIAAKFFFFKFKICQTVARHQYDQSISQNFLLSYFDKLFDLKVATALYRSHFRHCELHDLR